MKYYILVLVKDTQLVRAISQAVRMSIVIFNIKNLKANRFTRILCRIET